MASLKELLDYFAGCDLNNYNTPGHDNLQQPCRTGSNNVSNDKHNKNINTIRKKIGIISAISRRRENRKHTSYKTKEHFNFDHSIRWPFMTGLSRNYPAPTTAVASDVESNCMTTKTTTVTTTTKKTHRTATEAIHKFTQSTSLHGVQHVMGHRSVWRRMVWSVLVIGFVAWAAHNVYQIISDYNSYPVQTSVSSEYHSKMNFPAVTICNLNRIRLSKAPQQMVQNLPYWEICKPKNFTFFYNLQHGNCYTFAGSQDSNRSQWLLQSYFSPDQINLSLLRPCPPSTKWVAWSLKTRRKPKRRGKQWLAMRAGPGNGLSMEFDVQLDEYLPSSTPSGLKVLIHENEEKPFPEDGGIMAGTGTATSIAIKKTRIKRLALPYADCIAKVDVNNKDKNLFAEFGFAYSLNACQKSCVQKHIYKTCQCCSISFPCNEDALQHSTGMVAREDNTIPICNTTKRETFYCVRNIEEAFSDNKLDCIKNCPPACEKSSFSTTVSSAPWPTSGYRQTMLKRQGLDQNVTQLLKAERSFLKLEIYYDSLILDKIVGQPAFTWNKLLSDIGGQLGLLLGFSILTAVEILELVVMDLGLGIGLRSLWKRQVQKENC
ncbi:acid-sensing ion channel 1 [Plakobranchus ocellatus]|uniref:Acid-sensing ion channel 1 n=1 Tax=Plakobranchus ocellatus TaxID=259542 RepID=A0AAV3YA05_9GAST|nr:acid-sensing ion channel 1 [Plakobranchus ocellatus]